VGTRVMGVRFGFDRNPGDTKRFFYQGFWKNPLKTHVGSSTMSYKAKFLPSL